MTGATSGLGRRFAEVLHAAGANVVLAGRRADHLRDLHAQLERSLPVPWAIGDAEQRAALVAATVEAFGAIDLLVNNAGPPGSPSRHRTCRRSAGTRR